MPDLDFLLKSAGEKPGSPTPKRKFSRGIRPDHVSRGETLPQFHELVATEVAPTKTVTTALASSPSTTASENISVTPKTVATNPAVTKEVITETVSTNQATTSSAVTEQVSTKMAATILVDSETVATKKAVTKAVDATPATTKKVATESVTTYTPSALPNFTRIPNQVMECLMSEDFSTRELRILMVIIRETFGWGRAYAELSMTDLSKRTNISHPKIPATLTALESRGAIIRERQEKQAKNKYAVNSTYFQKWGSAASVTTNLVATPDLVTTEEVLGVSTTLAASGRSQSGTNYQSGFSSNSSGLEPQNDPLNKVIKERLNKSLSQESFEEKFAVLFQDHSAKSREREFEKFKNLAAQFPNESETILEVAKAVKSRGVDLRGQPIGSLMAYLELAYTQERTPFLEGKEKAQSRDARARLEQETKAREEEEFEADEKIYLANLERFKIEIPDHEDRVNLVRELCADAIWLKDPESPAALRIAVSKWAQSN